MIRRNGRTGYQEFNAYQTTAYLMQRQASRLGLSTHRRMTVKEVFDIEATVKMFKDERSKGGNAAGIDGVRRNEIHVSEFCNVARPIVKSIQDGTFVPEDLRRVDIPKPNGKMRTLNLNPLIERVVYKSAAQRLGQALASGFPSYMHGGLSERGPHTFFVGLQLAADKMADAPELWLVERDIISAFDNVALSAVQDSLVKMNLSQDLVETLIRVTNPEATRRRLE
jgi:retron-type reverse transcriptase